MPFVIITPMYPPHKTRDGFYIHFCVCAAIRLASPAYVNGSAAWFQRVGKQWKNF